MNDRFKIGAFGYFEFTMKKKNKYGIYYQLISGHYEIIGIDDKNLELTDGEINLIVTKRRISKFEKLVLTS